LKSENINKQVEIDELKTKITLMQESDKVITEYRRQLDEKSKLLLQNRQQIDELLAQL